MMMSHIDLNKEEFEIGQMCEWHPDAHFNAKQRSVEVSVVANTSVKIASQLWEKTTVF